MKRTKSHPINREHPTLGAGVIAVDVGGAGVAVGGRGGGGSFGVLEGRGGML